MKLKTTIVTLAIGQAIAQVFTGPPDPRLQVALTLNTPTTGVSTTPDGRIFLVLSHADGSKGPQIVEYHASNASYSPYPNAEWNSYAPGKDPATHFLNVNSQRIGPDGNLYIVDVGAPGFGQPVLLPSGPKLIQISLCNNSVSRTWPLGNATLPTSFLDDVRFNPHTGKAYLTDAGCPALVVLDLATGRTRRVLQNAPSTAAYMPVSAEGRILYAAGNGQPAHLYADQLEVSPDGQYLYFQPASGGMSRVPTARLDQTLSNSTLAGAPLSNFVEVFASTPSTGGTAIDAHGIIYLSDTDSQRILRIAPDGTKTLLVQDPRLLWVDAMWVGSDEKLYMPAAQLNRGVPFGDGRSNITKPLHVYTLDIGVGPSPIDHA